MNREHSPTEREMAETLVSTLEDIKLGVTNEDDIDLTQLDLDTVFFFGALAYFTVIREESGTISDFEISNVYMNEVFFDSGEAIKQLKLLAQGEPHLCSKFDPRFDD